MEPASIHVKWPHRRHLYRISRGSIVDSQWLHLGGSVGIQGLLSVRLHFLHLWFTVCSASFAIRAATCLPFFNLSSASESPTGSFTYVNEVLENVRPELRVIDFWVELKAEPIPLLILHRLHLTRLALSGDSEAFRNPGNLVIVTLPDDLCVRSSSEEWATPVDQFDRRGAEFRCWRLPGLTSIVACHELMTSAYSQYRDLHSEVLRAFSKLSCETDPSCSS